MMARRPSAFTQSDLTRELKAVRASGVEVGRVEIDKEGKIVVIIGEPNEPRDAREIVL
jgi:hypothetical protein